MPRLDARLEDRGVVRRRDARVVVENVDSPEALCGRGVHGGDRVLIRDIHLDGKGLATAERDGLLGDPEIDVRDADLRPFAGEDDRRFASHAATGTCDHADFPVEAAHHASVEMKTLLTSE